MRFLALLNVEKGSRNDHKVEGVPLSDPAFVQSGEASVLTFDAGFDRQGRPPRPALQQRRPRRCPVLVTNTLEIKGTDGFEEYANRKAGQPHPDATDARLGCA
jgi:hypothetical protein